MAFARSVHAAASSLPPAVDISEEFLERIQLKGVSLRSYQERGLQWLVQRYSSRLPGCILGDDMGLGKTLQSVAFLLYLASSLIVRPPTFLVVCPLSVISQWINELAKQVPHARHAHWHWTRSPLTSRTRLAPRGVHFGHCSLHDLPAWKYSLANFLDLLCCSLAAAVCPITRSAFLLALLSVSLSFAKHCGTPFSPGVLPASRSCYTLRAGR